MTISWEGSGTPLQYSCLKNTMDGGAWKAAVHGVAEGRTQLSDFTFTFISILHIFTTSTYKIFEMRCSYKISLTLFLAVP